MMDSSKQWPAADPTPSSAARVCAHADRAGSHLLRPGERCEVEGAHHDGAVEMVQAIGVALLEAVDLAKVHTTAGRCLTISSLVNAAAKTGDVEQLLASLEQLVVSWQAGA